MADPSASALSDRAVPMRVIVCGVHRTGTLSMRHALYRLGIHDCYHMLKVRDNPERDGHRWIRAIDAKYNDNGTAALTRRDWDGLLGECQGVCDVPAALFGPELAAAYPEAKVVILNRDPEKWYVSVLNSIHGKRSLASKLEMLFCMLFDSTTRAWVKFAMAFGGQFGYDHRTEKDKALAWYANTYKEFRDRIPEERRIEFTVADGWGPLCKFLDVPVPMDRDEDGKEVEAHFPRKNDTAAFLGSMDEWRHEASMRALDNVFRLIGKTVVAGSTAYVGYLAFKTRLGGRF